jgi:hypothetical protein
MSNVVSKLWEGVRKNLTVKDLPILAKAITDDYTTGQRCAVSMCYNIGYAWEIWHQRDDDDGFWEWLEDETPAELGKSRKAEKYLQVYRNVLADSAGENIKNIPFTKLLTLAATKGTGNQKGPAQPALPKQKRDALLKQLTGDNPPTTQDIKDEVKKALPEKVIPIKAKEAFIWPVFADRLAQYDGFMSPEKAARLFALDRQASPEDIRIMAKHWKQKYHPDKGGNKEEFETICLAEEVFTDSQNEKEVSA